MLKTAIKQSQEIRVGGSGLDGTSSLSPGPRGVSVDGPGSLGAGLEQERRQDIRNYLHLTETGHPRGSPQWAL